MTVEWYWPMIALGLLKVEPGSYGYFSYSVSRDCEAAEFTFFIVLPIFLFLLSAILTRLLVGREKLKVSRTFRRTGTFALLIYALLLTVGIGPYIELYPKDSGFIDLSFIEHILNGFWCAVTALAFWLGGKLGEKTVTGN